jgi:nitrogen fixation NifU-like protein
MTLDNALKVTRSDVADALDGLPPIKMHCSNLAADALHDAIKNWREGIKLEPLIPGSAPAAACGPAVTDMPTPEAPPTGTRPPIAGEERYRDRGLFKTRLDPAQLEGKRVLVLDTGPDSLAYALEATERTGRVVFLTPAADLPGDAQLRARAKRSDLKILLRSELMELAGEGAVERIRVRDLEEDEEYDLFVDAVVVLE